MHKKTLKIAYFGGHESGIPDFGRPFEVGGIKIEHTRRRAAAFFSRWDTEIGEKVIFFGKTLRTQKNSKGNFLGASSHGILTHSGFRKCI